VQFGYGNSFTPAANKWYKTTMVLVSPSGSVPVYIKIGQNNSPVPENERISMILPYNVTDFKEYNSPC
jgi:hypothetical protein